MKGAKHPDIQPRSLNITSMLVFALIAVIPISYMLMRSIWVDGELTILNYQSLFSDGRYLELLIRSIGIALSTAVLSVVFGAALALLLARTNIPARRCWQYLVLLPICIPPHIHAVAWIYLCGETGALNRFFAHFMGSAAPLFDIYTAAWTAFILALAFHPLITLMTYSGLVSMDQRLEEAALLYHSPATVLGKITLPLLWPHIMSGAVLVFIFAFFNYGVPSLLRVHTYPVEIFAQFSAFYNEGAATALSVPVMIVAMILLGLQRFWMHGRRYVVIATGKTVPLLVSLHKFKYLALCFVVILLGSAVGLPMVMLFFQISGLIVFKTIWQNAGQEIVWTTILAMVAATVIVLLSCLLGGSLWGKKRRYRGFLDFFYHMPLAIPATVLGIGLIYTWNHPATQMIYGTAAILVIAYAARFIPFSLQAILAGMRQISPNLREAALLYQASWCKRTLAIDIPLCLPALAAGWCIAFILCMGELGTTLLVIPPGMGTIALKIYTLMHYGANQMVAVLALILIMINLSLATGVVMLSKYLKRRRP